MHKLVWGMLIVLLFSVFAVHAVVECNDLDEQPDIEDTLDSAAKVEYGIEDKTDICVSGRDGYSKNPSTWVREYYCATVSGGEGPSTVQRKYEDFDCTRFGFTKCDGGKCTGTTSGTSGSTATPTSTSPFCGDKKIQTERGEQCDPPDDICYLTEKIGICTRPIGKIGGCQCKLYQTGETAAPEAPPEEEETPEPPGETPDEPEEQPPEEPPKAEPVAQPAEREPLPTEFQETGGIGVTRGITNTVKRFFSWIGSWFD